MKFSDSRCTLLVDTGSDISIIKASKVKLNQICYPTENCSIKGIGEGLNKVNRSPLYNHEDYAKELNTRLHMAHERTRKYIDKEKLKRIEKQNHLNPVTFHIDDEIAITNENRKKLDPIYKGPYKVKQIEGTNLVIENDLGTITTVHKNRAIKL